MSGPLASLRVIELGGIGPGTHAAMLLADLGADVVRIERPSGGLQVVPTGIRDWQLRGRRSVVADLKDPADLALARNLINRADVLIEGFRPGVTDRLGIGPGQFTRTNPKLVYARMTGWGQDGPRSQRAGHDINYISVTGLLHAIGSAGGPPIPPLNIAGDFGGGSTYLVIGILAAILERTQSGHGQVIDAAIVDGVASLSQIVWALGAAGRWTDARGVNLLDGGAPFYATYICADGRYVAVGAIEPQFYAILLRGLDVDPATLPAQHDQTGWLATRDQFARVFASRTRDEWVAVFADSDACVTPVLSLAEAPLDPHLAARATLPAIDGVVQAAPAPRFSRTVPGTPLPPPEFGAHTDEVLHDWGVDPQAVRDGTANSVQGKSADAVT
ncbi:MAG: CaiB/BaiF CoA transferase family protein [Acidimicrobiales bacterium]